MNKINEHIKINYDDTVSCVKCGFKYSRCLLFDKRPDRCVRCDNEFGKYWDELLIPNSFELKRIEV